MCGCAPSRRLTASVAASGMLNGKPPPNFVHGHTIKATIQDAPNGVLVTKEFSTVTDDCNRANHPTTWSEAEAIDWARNASD